jgi:cAMP phosphodiesterase
MEVRILPSAANSSREKPYATSFLINGTVAIDAGCLGFYGHADHIATLPILIENAFDLSQPAMVVHGLPETLDAVKRHVFNDVIWPDFLKIGNPERPFLTLREFTPEQEFEVEGLKVLPVLVNHVVPTAGFIIQDGRSAAVFGADSGPTDRLWKLLHDLPAPRSVFLEASFPNSMRWLADASGHLTPELFQCEVSKMPETERVIAVHIKRRFEAEIVEELLRLGLPNLVIGEADAVYSI